MSAWGDFLNARLRLIHEWHNEGIPGKQRYPTADEICTELNRHDPGQIRLLLATPPESVNNGPTTMAEVQIQHFHRTLKKYGGNITRTCDVLGIGRTTAYRWVKKIQAGESSKALTPRPR